MSQPRIVTCRSFARALVTKNAYLPVDTITVDVDATKGEKTIEKVAALVVVRSAEPEEKVRRILDKTMATCPVGILYEQAGVVIEIILKVE